MYGRPKGRFIDYFDSLTKWPISIITNTWEVTITRTPKGTALSLSLFSELQIPVLMMTVDQVLDGQWWYCRQVLSHILSYIE